MKPEELIGHVVQTKLKKAIYSAINISTNGKIILDKNTKFLINDAIESITLDYIKNVINIIIEIIIKKEINYEINSKIYPVFRNIFENIIYSSLKTNGVEIVSETESLTESETESESDTDIDIDLKNKNCNKFIDE